MKKMSKYARDRLQYKNKPRKVLSLEERVQALRMFDQTPVYQRVATAFGCSWEQIKNVVLSRDEILNYYARCQTVQPDEHPNQIRKKKIIFLGNAVFEFIKRATYHQSLPLDEDEIRARALEFRNAIEIEQFYPNNAWLNDFKRVFNVELPNPDNIVFTQTPPKSLDCNDIIAYCREEIQKLLVDRDNECDTEKSKLFASVKPKNGNGVSRILKKHGEQSERTNYNDEECEDKDNNHDGDADADDGNDDDDDGDDTAAEDEEGLTIDFSHYEYNDTGKPEKTNATKRSSDILEDSSTIWSKRVKEEPRSNSPSQTTYPEIFEDIGENKIKNTGPISTSSSIPPQILCPQSALAHLIPLQDYALGEEDFVAINLLANLAEHYRRDIPKDTH